MTNASKMALDSQAMERFNATCAQNVRTGFHKLAGVGFASTAIGDVSLKTPFFVVAKLLLNISKSLTNSKA
jgi:hypothetical protein